MFQPPVPVWVVVGAGLVLVGMAGFGYWRTRTVLGPWRRALLLGLRLAVIAGLLVVLLRPMELLPVPAPSKRPVFHVLLDTSLSMNTGDCGSTSRWAAAQQQLRAAENSVLGELARRYEVQFHRFDRELRPIGFSELLAQPAADGQNTDLTAALAGLASSAAGRPQAGALLISDGRDNGGGDIELTARSLRSARLPVWTTVVGAATGTKDVCVTARLSQNFLFARQPARLEAELVQTGYDNWYAKVSLWREDKLVTTRQMLLKPGANRVEFPVREDHKGVFQYTVVVEPLAGEADQANNRRALFARVVDQKPRLLLVEAEPYWDTKFLQRALRADPNLELTTVFQLSPKKIFAVRERTSGSTLEKQTENLEAGTAAALGGVLPQTREDWFQYDCVILGHGVDSLLGTQQVALLEQYLTERGGSIVCARGRASAAPARSGLDALEPLAWAAARLSNAQLELTTEGRLSPIFAFNKPAATESILRELPSLLSVTRIEREKSLAVILARGKAEGQPQPVATVAYQRYGRGKVMSIGATGLWRWAFLPEDQKDKDDIYRLFWAQMIRWLIDESDFLPGQDISFRTDRYNYTLGDRVRFAIHTKHLDLANYKPVIELSDRTGLLARLQPAADADAPGVYTAFYTADREGEFSARLVNNIGQPQQDIARFTVYSDLVETRLVAADPERLARIAQASGAELVTPDQWSRLPAKLRQIELDGQEKAQPKDAWDREAVFFALMALLGAEWFLRRQWGLV